MNGVTNIQGLSNITNESVSKEINYNGFYRGFVISTDDPLHLGRIRVRIPAIHGSVSTLETYVADSSLPWAFPGSFMMSGPDMGQLLLPLLGSTVWVSFEVDNPNNPIYFGSLYSVAPTNEKILQGPRFLFQGDTIPVTKDDLSFYKSSRYVLLKTLKGASIVIDDSDMLEGITISDVFNQKIEFINDGELVYYGITPDIDKCRLVLSSGNSSITLSNSGIDFNGKLPYQYTFFVDSNLVPEDVIFNLSSDVIFSDQQLSTKVDSLINGARILYINSEGRNVGYGYIYVSGSTIEISTSYKEI